MIYIFLDPIIYISSLVVQLASLPLGRGLAAILPTKQFNTFSYIWSLNPGPFSIKEHVCITVMANLVNTGALYSNYVTLTQRIFYNQTTPIGYQILLALGSQSLGFCLGGLLRQFVVWPSSMIWPGILGTCTFFNTFHKNSSKHDQGHMSREKLFYIAVAGSFAWYWLPGYIFTGLSTFNWVCWIAPKNVVINSLFGTNTGLGMSFLTFDWGIISFIGNPLITPVGCIPCFCCTHCSTHYSQWWFQMNMWVAFLLMFWLIAPILYCKTACQLYLIFFWSKPIVTNVWNSAYFPISGRILFDNTGFPYTVQRIITNGIFDPVKYAAYSPVFMPTTLVLVCGAAFATFPAIFMHTFCKFLLLCALLHIYHKF